MRQVLRVYRRSSQGKTLPRFLNAHLHSGENRAKLVRFKEQNFFLLFYTLRLSAIFVIVETRLYLGNTTGGSITVLLTSCLTGLDYSVLQIKTKIESCYTADSKPVKQEVNGTVMLPPLVFPALSCT